MSYIENRIVHDADSHTMELPTWYKEFGSKKVQKAFLDRFECRNASKYAPNELQTLLERLKRSERHKYPFLCQKMIEICSNF